MLFSYDLLIVFFFVIYLVLISRLLKNAKLKNPKLDVKKWLLSESLFIPGFLIFSLMFIRLLVKLFQDSKYFNIHNMTLYFLILNLRYEDLHKNW
jgi:cytochrome b561